MSVKVFKCFWHLGFLPQCPSPTTQNIQIKSKSGGFWNCFLCVHFHFVHNPSLIHLVLLFTMVCGLFSWRLIGRAHVEQTCSPIIGVFLFISDTQTVGQLVVLGLGLIPVLDVLVVALPPWNTQHMWTRQERTSIPLPLALTAAEEDVASDPFVLKEHTVLRALVESHLAGIIDKLDSVAHRCAWQTHCKL